jgi:hypothetical protein
MGNDLLKDALNDFHARGFRVWMDDFGSGYSSLNLLAQFHFDVVKFDIRFVRNLEDGSSGQLILEKMLELIEALGIGTLIEGVESKEQLELLRKIDGQRIQGYLYSRPRPLSQLIWFSQNGGNLTYENPEKEHYYDEISMVSLRKPLQYENIKFDSDMEMEFPAEVIEISEDQKVTILRKNEHQAEFSRLFGTADANGEIRFLPDADSEIAELFRKASESMVWERLKIGCGAEQNAESTVFVHYISRDPLTGSVAYLAVIV